MFIFYLILFYLGFSSLTLGDAITPPAQPSHKPEEPNHTHLLLASKLSSSGPQPQSLRFFQQPILGDSPIDQKRRNAQLAVHRLNFDEAQVLYLQIMHEELSLPQRLELLLEMNVLYELSHQTVKQIATLENFIELGKADPRKPEAYLELGHLYRRLGDFKKAQQSYHNVLNSSLAAHLSQFESIQSTALKAKIEIAETYLLMGDYPSASHYLNRIKHLNLSPKDRERVDFEIAHLFFLQGDFNLAAVHLQRFVDDFPDSSNKLEASFMLCQAYRELRRFEDALGAVLNLIQDEKITQAKDFQTILYWKIKAGNQVANAFYEQGDYAQALSIYQAMAPLNDDPNWQWPVLYQIGLCFEHLKLIPKAQEAYTLIVDGDDQKKQLPAHPNQLHMSSVAIQESAQWRLKQIEWGIDFNKRLQQLQPPVPFTAR